jgi:hypothetical protein
MSSAAAAEIPAARSRLARDERASVQRGRIDLRLEEVIHLRLDVVHADADEVHQRRFFDSPDGIEHRISAH